MMFSRVISRLLLTLMLAVLTASNVSALQPGDETQIRVRLGQHPDYSRIVFDFPLELPYRAAKNENAVTVVFEASFVPDLTAFDTTNLRYTARPSVSSTEGQTSVTFAIGAENGLRHFRSGSSVVIDILEEEAVTRRTDRAGSADAPPSTADSPATASPRDDSADESARAVEQGQEDIADNDVVSAPTLPPVDAQALPAAVPGTPLPVSFTASFDRFDVVFDLPFNAALAVFERAGTLWIVFDRPFSLAPRDIGRLLSGSGGRITSLVQDANIDATILRLTVLDNQSAVIERDQLKWTVSLKDNIAKPRFPLNPIRRVESGGRQIFIPVANVGRKIEVEDPNVGDILTIVGVLDEGRGVPEDHAYSMANILETSQGVVVAPLRDDVAIDRFREGVSVSVGDIDVTRAANAAGADNNQYSRLIDFRAWRLGERWEYKKYLGRLLYELSTNQGDENETRWKLARFYLAHGRSPEALGLLGLMLDSDPTLSQNAEFLAVRGVAKVKRRRFEEAEADLSDPSLSSEQDVELWRSLIAAAQDKYVDVLEHYRLGRDVIGTYDDADKAEIQLGVIEAALHEGRLDLAREELQLLNGLALSEYQLNRSILLSAEYQQKLGNDDVALLQLEDLAEAEDYEISAMASLRHVRQLLARGEIDNAEAIARLEPLFYQWRGDRFIVSLSDTLSDLYFAENQYALGLELLKRSSTYYPEIASSPEFTFANKMGTVFSDLFLGGEADALEPVQAIALFSDFQELTPFGVDGDTMIRRLSERLVALDLLDRAAELLKYQVSNRLEGAARAQVAGNLAKIYILNQEPDKAIDIIRVTREPRLPEDILAERTRIESRALIEKAQYEEADVLIEQDRSANADKLRADIYWNAKDWQRFIAVSRRLLGDGWRTDSSLSPSDKLNLIRLCIAMTFTEDRDGLIELRRRYGNQMREGDFSRAFASLTGDQELSGRELGVITSEIASVEKLQTFLRDYRADFSTS